MTLRTSKLRDEADRVLVLRNPKAGAGPSRQRLDEVVSALESRGLTVDVDSDLNRVTDRAEKLSEQGTLRTVLAAGGDGTAELVVNQIPASVPLSILPLGTENLLAKYLGIAGEPKEMAEMIANGVVAQFDLGRLTANDHSRLFLLMMGCGFDAEVVRRLHADRTGHINHLSYIKPIFDSVRSYDYPPLRVVTRDRPDGAIIHEITAHWVFVFNTPSYAIGLEICPQANPYDGQLDVTTFEGGSFWHGLFHLSSIVVGQHSNLAGVSNVQGRCIRIESERKVPFQVDGDPGGELPVEIETLAGRLAIIVPADWSDRENENLAEQASIESPESGK